MTSSRNTQRTAFLKERFEKEENYFRVYDTYTPDYKKTLLTTKFYSKYEGGLSVEDADPVLMGKIQKAKYDTPKEKYPYPLTENQRYGWFSDLIFPHDRTDRRFYQPRRSNDFIKHELRLKMDESTFPKVKFVGVPFKI